MWATLESVFGQTALITFIAVVGILGFLAVNALFLILLERKVAAAIQMRLGPMEAGPHGAFQTIADMVKLLGKEIITPRNVDKWVYILAPVLVFTPVIALISTLPFVDEDVFQIHERVNLPLLLIFAFSGITMLAVFMGAWASNNKYGLLGGMRAVAQNIAYEIPLLISALTAVMLTTAMGESDPLRFDSIVRAQDSVWFVFLQPIAFLIYFVSAVAETNRAPFDIPEAESELVAGFHTEYPGMRFAMFFFAEYSNMFLVCGVTVALFLGGSAGPFGLLDGPWWFFAKAYFLIYCVMWFRWTFPRLRFDQLMNLAWKILIPISLINLLLTALVIKVL